MNDFNAPPKGPEQQITSAQDLKSLYALLIAIGPIQGSKIIYTPEKTMEIIEPIREKIANGIYDTVDIKEEEYPLVTRTYGLRAKVRELLNKEVQIRRQSLKGKSQSLLGNKESKVRTTEQKMNPIDDIESLEEFLAFIKTNNIPRAAQYLEVIPDIVQGWDTIYNIEPNRGLRDKLHELIWKGKKRGQNEWTPPDSEPIPGQRPWIYTSNGAQKGDPQFFSDFNGSWRDFGIGEKEFGWMQDTLCSHLEDKKMGAGSMTLSDSRGNHWEVSGGLGINSGRNAIRQIRPANTATELYLLDLIPTIKKATVKFLAEYNKERIAREEEREKKNRPFIKRIFGKK